MFCVLVVCYSYMLCVVDVYQLYMCFVFYCVLILFKQNRKGQEYGFVEEYSGSTQEFWVYFQYCRGVGELAFVKKYEMLQDGINQFQCVERVVWQGWQVVGNSVGESFESQDGVNKLCEGDIICRCRFKFIRFQCRVYIKRLSERLFVVDLFYSIIRELDIGRVVRVCSRS